MSSVKVPITKADVLGQKSARARKDQRLREEFKKQQLTIPLPNSDLQFLKNVHDEGRFQIAQANSSATGTIVSIVPPTAITFYFLGAVFNTQISSGTATFNLENDGTRRERHTFQGNGTAHSFKFGLDFDSMVGDGIKAYTVTWVESATASVNATLWGYFASTPTTSGVM